MDNLDKLIAQSAAPAQKPSELDRRIVMALAEQTLRRANRRNRQTMILSLLSCVVLIVLVAWLAYTLVPQNIPWPESIHSVIVELVTNFTPRNILLLLGGCASACLILLGIGTYSYRFKE